MNLKDAYRKLAASFRQAKLATPELDARFLLAAVANKAAAQVPFDATALNKAQQQQLEKWRGRRLQHESVARIIGSRGFWTLDLQLSPATLEPRPDSETLIEAALEHLSKRRNQPLRILDLGAGSGALLLALLAEFPHACGIGTDISHEALLTARRNAGLHHLDGRAAFVRCRWGEALAGRFDLIVSNPPYGRSEDMAALPDEVRLYDPHFAIDGGKDGFDAYRAIAASAGNLLAEGGLLLLEAGDGQAAEITSLFDCCGYDFIGKKHDLGGHARVVVFAHQRSKKAKSRLNKNCLEKPARGAKTSTRPEDHNDRPGGGARIQ
jgi:release factor glutamine methyltransferase